MSKSVKSSKFKDKQSPFMKYKSQERERTK